MAKQALGQDSLIGHVLGHYRIIEEIGAGGMGVVYRACDEHLDRDVAIKILPSGLLADDAARLRFHKEAHALSKLNHPNIATVHDFDSCDGIEYLAEELVPGVSLDEKLSSGPLIEEDIVNLGTQLCEGLAAAHARGVLHRDIKPSNLRVTPEAHLKIIDFGLAKNVVITSLGADEQVTISGTQSTVGTLPYMSPEQMRNEEVDSRTDIWAAGCVLYEMATGRRPFLGQGTAVVNEILTQTPPPPSRVNRKVTPGLESIIQKCLEKDRGHRYRSAHEIANDLRRFQRGGLRSALLTVRLKRLSRVQWAGLCFSILLVAMLFLAFNVGNLRGRLTSKPGTPRISSLAVLPVKNFSGDPGQEFLADGMTDELIAGLSQIKAVNVISRTSVMHYKGTTQTLPEIAKELNVDGIVEASLVRSGERVRLTAQLIDARQDRHLWASNYERKMTDVLMLQSDLVQAIAGEIKAQLTPEESERLSTARRVEPEVYDTTLKGKAILEYATRESQIRHAIELFQRAVDRDPTYAPAWAGLGEAMWELAATGFEFVSPDQVRQKAISAAERALQLDPSSPEAHNTSAFIAFDGEWDIAKAQQQFERALELRPSYAAAHNLYGQMLSGEPLQSFDEGRQHLERAREVDPLSPWNDLMLLAWWLYQGRPEQALEEGERALQRNPTLWVLRWQLGFAQLNLGRPDQAIPEFESALKLLYPDRPVSALAPLGLAYGLSGHRDDALRILQEMKQKPYVSPYDLAVVYSGLGQMDKAFQLLDTALEQRTPWLVYCTRYDPKSVALRRDSRWKTFIQRLRQRIRLPQGTPDLYS